MGSQLIKSDLVKAGDFKQIEQDVRDAVALVKKIRLQYPAKI
jgi:2-keto-3-deoxy-6-phosphogluconate aldolase